MTCLADFSGPVTTLPLLSRRGEPVAGSTCGTPALRKYLLTMMSVASWDQGLGISASFISKTTDPSGLVIRLVRFSYSTDANGSCPCLVKRRVIFMAESLLTHVAAASGYFIESIRTRRRFRAAACSLARSRGLGAVTAAVLVAETAAPLSCRGITSKWSSWSGWRELNTFVLAAARLV